VNGLVGARTGSSRRWTDVDLERKTLRVRGTLARIDGDLVVTDPETAKSRRFVPISAPTERILREIRTAQAQQRLLAGSLWRATGYVFTAELGEPCGAAVDRRHDPWDDWTSR